MRLKLLALCSLALGCSTALYQGPQRPASEVAIVRGTLGAHIVSIDGAEVDGGSFERYEVLPGRHALRFEGRAANIIGPDPICLTAKPGHRYIAETFSAGGGSWGFEIRDETVNKGVPVGICPRQASPEPDPATAVLLRPHLPRMGLFFGVGYEGGGDNLVKASMSNGEDREINAGAGGVFPLGGTITPLWIGDVLGLGVGASAAIKVQSIKASNGSAMLLRYPLSLWLQSYIALSPAWFVSLAGGTNKDLSPSLSGEGVASDLKADFGSSWGWFVDSGILWLDTWHFGGLFSLRYTNERYHIAGHSLDASSFGFRMTFNLNR